MKDYVLAINVVEATSTDYGKNIATWGLDQLFWVILLAGIGVAAFAIVKKSWIGALVSVLATAIITYFINNPTKLSDIGDAIGKIIGF